MAIIDTQTAIDRLATKTKTSVTELKNKVEQTETSITGITSKVTQIENDLPNKQSKLGMSVVNIDGASTVINENGFFSSNNVSGVRQVASQNYHLVDKQYVDEVVSAIAKNYDFTDTPQVISFSQADPTAIRFQVIPKPASSNDAPIGAEIKLLPKLPANSPQESRPLDTDQVTFGTDQLWIDQSKTNIINWSEVKTQITQSKIMVITKLSDGNYQLVRWEETGNSIVWIDKTAEHKAGGIRLNETHLGKRIRVVGSYYGEKYDQILEVIFGKGFPGGETMSAIGVDGEKVSFNSEIRHIHLQGGRFKTIPASEPSKMPTCVTSLEKIYIEK